MEQEYHLIGKYNSILYRLSQAFISAELKEDAIGSGQYPFLLVLYQYDGISQEELSNRLIIDKGTTARAVSKLEAAGYVQRRSDPDDRRLNRVYLTQQGRDVRPKLYETLGKWSEVMLKDLSQDEQEFLLHTLHKVVISIQKQNRE